MNELTKIKDRILERIETYIGDIEFAEEKELTEDEKTIFESVKNIINEELNKQLHTEQIIKDTIKEYLDKDCDDVTELLLALNKDLCERIRKASLEAPLPRFIIDKDGKIKQFKKPQTNTAKWVTAGTGIDCIGNRFKEYKCSNCGNIDLSHRKNKYCPGCGKRMVE